jgi:hypothetical protein
MPSNEPIEFLLVLRTFGDADCDVVLIGGLALQLLGGDYMTIDVDFAFRRSRENAKKISSVLRPFNPRPVDWPEGVPFVWDEQTVFSSTSMTLDTDIGRIDLLAEPSGAPGYDDLLRRALTLQIKDFTVKIASIEDLISMKLAAGRPKDLAHVEQLQCLRTLGTGADEAHPQSDSPS